MSEMPNRYNHDDPDAVAERKVNDAQYAYLRMVGAREMLTPEEEKALNQKMLEGKEAQTLVDAGQRVQELLTGQETQELLVQVAMGREARGHIIEANLRLPYKLAKEKYRSEYMMDSTDLASCAIEGLIKAVNRFDYRKAKLSTYATSAIENLIPRVVAKEGRMICVSEDMGRHMKKYDAVKSEFAGKLTDHEPTDEEYAAATEFPIDKIVLFRTIEEQRPISYDQPVGSKDIPLINILADERATIVSVEEQVLAREGQRSLESLFSVLDKQEEEIVRRYYGIGYETPMTYEKIGQLFGRGHDAMRKITEKALKKFRWHLSQNPEKSQFLHDLLG
jgi:RNA polymerase primary sigma factor